MKQQIFSITDPKFRDRIINLLQSTNGGHQTNPRNSSNGYNLNNNSTEKNSSPTSSFDSYQTNFQNQIYGSTSAATLQQLKKILIEQAKELKKCKNDLIEKDTEIARLKGENETVRKNARFFKKFRPLL